MTGLGADATSRPVEVISAHQARRAKAERKHRRRIV